MTTTTHSDLVTMLRHEPGKGWSGPFPKGGPGTLALVFGGTEYAESPAPLAELAAAMPGATIAGCSTAGEVLDDTLRDGTLAVAVMPLRRTRLASAWAPIRSAGDSFHAGELLATALEGPALRGVIVFASGVGVNGSELVRGLNHRLGGRVTVTGGLAGDGTRFEKTWVLRDGVPIRHGVSAVGLSGEHVRVGFGTWGGWDVFGPERRVTKARDNVLLELDGKPALEVYAPYLGERAKDLPGSALLFPLAVRATPASPVLVRTVLGVDRATGSMTFAGDMPVGAIAQLMRTNMERLIDGAASASSCGLKTMRDQGPCLQLAVSCVGRRMILGPRTEEELASAYEALPEGSRQIGFYSYGEIAPSGLLQCSADLHNQSMTITTIREV